MGEKVNRVSLEDVLDNIGAGPYSRRCLALSAAAAVAYSCVSYGGAIVVPAGACELRAAPKHQATMLAAPFVAGVVGSVVWGWQGDVRGRRRALLATLGGSALFNACGSLAPSWQVLLALQCASTFLASGVYPLSITLLSESTPRATRDRSVLVVASVMLCSQGIMAGLAIPIIPLTFSYHLPALRIYWNSWRTLMLVYSVPSIVAGLGIWLFVQESPKFTLAKGDEKGALRILNTIHRINNTHEEFQVQRLVLVLEEQEAPGAGAPPAAARGRWAALFRAPLRKYMIICTFLFIGMQFVTGFLIWLPKISNQLTRLFQTGEGSDVSLCTVIESNLHSEQQALEAPAGSSVSCAINVSALLLVLALSGLVLGANGLLSLAVGRFGRRNSVMVVVCLCGASGALVAAAPSAGAGAALYAGLLVGIVVVGPYTAIAIGLFPTHLRTLAVAVTLTGGRLCGFFTIQAAGYLLAHRCRLGFLLYSAVFASSALLLLLLPGDRRRAPAPAPAHADGVAMTLLQKPTE